MASIFEQTRNHIGLPYKLGNRFEPWMINPFLSTSFFHDYRIEVIFRFMIA